MSFRGSHGPEIACFFSAWTQARFWILNHLGETVLSVGFFFFFFSPHNVSLFRHAQLLCMLDPSMFQMWSNMSRDMSVSGAEGLQSRAVIQAPYTALRLFPRPRATNIV